MSRMRQNALGLIFDIEGSIETADQLCNLRRLKEKWLAMLRWGRYFISAGFRV